MLPAVNALLTMRYRLSLFFRKFLKRLQPIEIGDYKRFSRMKENLAKLN